MRKYFVILMALLFSASWSALAVAQDTPLAEKLLIILKQNHQITQQQYDELLMEAQHERASQKAAVQNQVKEATAQAAKQYKKDHPLNVTASWKHNQIFFESNDGNFTMHVGGYAQVDFGGSTANYRLRYPAGTALSATGGVGMNKVGIYDAELRRVKPTLEGTLYGDFDYKVQIDFGGGGESLQDVWMTYYGFPCIANIRVGHMKEPFSLEELTSDEWLEFTERSQANSFITAGNNSDRNTGIMAFNNVLDQRMTWAAGGFMQQQNTSGTSYQSFDNVNFSGRVTYLPWYADNGCQLLHLGLGYRHLWRTDNDVQATNNLSTAATTQFGFLSTPEFHLFGVKTVDTGAIGSTGADMINPELALVYGPFSLQGEFMDTFLNNAYEAYTYTTGTHRSNANLYGWYVEGSWFVTGEHRAYDKKFGVFGRPTPNCNFDPASGGWGAWELAARYDAINLNDETISGGSEQNYTGAINWYLNPNLKWAFEYTHAHMNGVIYQSLSTSSQWNIRNGDADIFDTRFQVDF